MADLILHVPAPGRPCDNKTCYADKKSAVTAMNARTRGHQRNRPVCLRPYPCPLCKGWHLTHKEE